MKVVPEATAVKAVQIDVKDAIIEDIEYTKKVNSCVKTICEVEIYTERVLFMTNCRDTVADMEIVVDFMINF